MKYDTYIDKAMLLILMLVGFGMLWLYRGDEKMQAFVCGFILSQSAGLLTLMQGRSKPTINTTQPE